MTDQTSLVPFSDSDSPYWDTETKRQVFPNALKQHFVVAKPNVAWCVDTCTLYKRDSKDRKKAIAEVFLAVDLGDGRVVAHCCKKKITSLDVVNSLAPAISYARATRDSTQPLIIHSDRGSVFASKMYTNLMVLHNFVILSHSAAGSPTQNSPVERLNRTILRSPKNWAKLNQPDPMNLTFSSAEDCAKAVDALVYDYNNHHKSDRSLGFAPAGAHWAFIWAKHKGLIEPDVLLTWSDMSKEHTTERVELQELLAYRSMVRQLADVDILQPPNSPAEKQIRDVINNSALAEVNQGRDAATNTIILQQLERIALSLENKTATRRRLQKCAVKEARPARDPLTPEIAQALADWAIDATRPIHQVRDVLTVLVLYGSGCRVSETLSLTHQELANLITTGGVFVQVRKKGKKERKTISAFHARLAASVYDSLIDKSKQISYTYNIDSAVFVTYGNTVGKNLNANYYNRTVNSTLQAFSADCPLITNYNRILRTHSGRIGFVTGLRQGGADLNTVRQMVHHDDVRSTARYDRYLLSDTERNNLVNTAWPDTPVVSSSPTGSLPGESLTD